MSLCWSPPQAGQRICRGAFSYGRQTATSSSSSSEEGGGHRGPARMITIHLALGLSLSLFALALLEAAPTHWLFWLRNISAAYRTVLWGMTAVVVVLIPSSCGTQILARRAFAIEQNVDDEERKKLSFKPSREHHPALRLLYKSLSVLANTIYYVLLAPIYYAVITPVGRLVCRKRKEKGPILAMNNVERSPTSREEESKAAKNHPLLLILRDASFRQSAILGTIGGTLLVGGVLAGITPLVIEVSSQHDTSTLARAVSWLCATGILLSALLNGFGSVSLPYSCLAGLFLEPVHPDAIAKAEIELQQARTSLTSRLQEVKNLSVALPSSSSTNNLSSRRSSSSSRWSLRKVVRRNFSDLGDEVSHRRSALLAEIDFVDALIEEMSADVEEMRSSQAVSEKARTTTGRIRSWIGVVFSVVLLVRLCSSVSSVWYQYHYGFIEHRSGADPITRMLLWLLGHHVVSEEDLQRLSQFISLILTGLLSISQLRNFLRTATTVQRRLSILYRRCYCKPRCTSTSLRDRSGGSVKSSTDFEGVSTGSEYIFSNLVASLMCCYCLACVVLTKMMLPFEYRSEFSAVLGMEEGDEEREIFLIRTFAVNVLFSLTALVSALVLAVILGIMKANTSRYSKSIDNHAAVQLSPKSVAEPLIWEP